MKITAKLISTIGAMLILYSPVLAATGREDNSNVLIWAFLGICGLIVFLQMVPVFSLVYGLIKGVAGGKKETMSEELETVSSKYQ